MPDIQTTPAPAAPGAASCSDLAMVRNRTFDEITVGETASIERTLSYKDIELFAVLSGDVNPQHLDADYALCPWLCPRSLRRLWARLLCSLLLQAWCCASFCG